MALDKHGRNLTYLRISLTDVCNLRCVYCMPEHMRFRPAAHLLRDGEIVRLARIFAGLGFNRIRFTGGEPTLRPRLVELVREVAAVPGIGEVALTTNGLLLDHLAAPLRDAGLRRVNISLDTLDPAKFRSITRWGNLRDVLAGIAAAEHAGLPVKLNAAVVRGLNDGEDAVELARMTRERGWHVRYIELMPFGGITEFQVDHVVPEEELRATIAAALGPLELLHGGQLQGEARLYRLAGASGTLGFISSVSHPFCASCNRARLTADGKLRLCLLRDDEADLLPLLRDGADDERLAERIAAALWHKPWGHGLATGEFATGRAMSEIGG